MRKWETVFWTSSHHNYSRSMVLVSWCQPCLTPVFSSYTIIDIPEVLFAWKFLSVCVCVWGQSSSLSCGRSLCSLDFWLAGSQEKTSHYPTSVMPHGRQSSISSLFSEIFTYCYDQMPIYYLFFQWYIEVFGYLFIDVLFIPKPFIVHFYHHCLNLFHMAITGFLRLNNL